MAGAGAVAFTGQAEVPAGQARFVVVYEGGAVGLWGRAVGVLPALLNRLPRDVLRGMRLVVRPDTVLRWHRSLVARRHAAVSRPKRRGRPRTVRSVRDLVLRLVRGNPSWGYRRVHGELLVLGVKVAASTVWEILREAGIDPAPEWACTLMPCWPVTSWKRSPCPGPDCTCWR